MNPTGFLSCALSFLSRVLSFLPICGSTPQSGSEVHIPHTTREQEEPNGLHSEEYCTESTVGEKSEYVLITRIRATGVVITLRRIPVGFYVAVQAENMTKRTSNKPMSVGKDLVEWDDEIILPLDRSSRISLTVFASFELGPTLGDGEALRKFDTTVGELLDRHGQSEPVKFVEQSDGEVDSSRSSFEIEIKRRAYGRNEYTGASSPPDSEEMHQLGDLTGRGHHALNRYRELQEQRDLDESISFFEQARDLCPPNHPNHATVLFNLANAKLICYRANDVSADLGVPINLYRGVLGLRPRGHPDHPFTLLSLGIALHARFQRQHDEADGAEGESLLSQVLDVAPSDSYTYHAAVLALGSTAKPELIQSTEISESQTIENDLDDDDGEVQRLDAVLQWIFHPDSCDHVFLDHLGTLLCVRFNRLGDLGDPEKAISMLEVVVRFTSDDHPEKPSWLDDFGDLLLARYTRYGDRVDLEKSITMLEDAVQFTPDGDPDKPLWLSKLGHSLFTRYQHFGDVDDLERSILLRGDALQLTSDGHSDRPLRLSKLGQSLLARYERFGDVANLQRSISLFEDAVRLTLDGDPNKPAQLNNLGNSLSTRYERFGEIVDLERSVSLREDALQITSDGHPKKPVRLNNLSQSLLARYERFGDVADLQRSITLKEDALQFTPDGHRDRPLRLNNLGGSLSTRYERFGDIADLERTISLYKDAVQCTPDGHADRPTRLYNLGDSLLTRFKRFGDVIDLKESIPILEDALQLTPNDHPDKALLLNSLGYSLSTRYERFGDTADLKRSILLKEDALQLTPEGHPDKPGRLNNLGMALLTRYERFGDIVDLERSISLFKDTVQFTPDGHPDILLRQSNLGSALSTRYQRLGEIVDLERSIFLFEDAVQLTPDGHPDKPLRLDNLSHSSLARYERFGDVVDMERSVSLREDALRFTPEGHPDVPLRLNNLSYALLTRYERLGGIVDLEKSTSLLEDAVQFTPDGHPDKPSRLDNLGESLSSRYRRFGDVTDLKKSILLREDALQFTPEGHQDRLARLSNLGRSLSTRYERFRDTVDLERSISLLEDAVQLAPDGHPSKLLWLNNLGDLLSTRYEHFGDVTCLERSISLFKDAVQFTPDGHHEKPTFLHNLGHSLFTRYRRFEDVADLEKSISMFEDAVQFTPDGHPDKTSRLSNLAESLLGRFQHSGRGDSSNSDLSRAILHSERATRSSIGSSLHRFLASRVWIHCIRILRNDSKSLLDAYTVAIDLLPQLAWIGLSLHDRYHQLLEAADGACDAASAALDAHRPELAVEWLEQGRSIMWNQLSQLRTPVDDLRTAHPDLAAKFEHVSRGLEYASARDYDSVRDKATVLHEFASRSNIEGEVLEKEARQHHALALLRESLLAEIRALPGFERFLLPKTIEQLSSLAHSGPIVFLNASIHRCDALVVMPGSDVVHVPLSNTSYDEVVGMQLQLNKLLRFNGRVISRDASDRGARVRGMTPDDVFRSILPYLWEKVVSPILEVLPLSKLGPRLPRIFWCPTGPFSFLPIHAAGLYGTANPGAKLSDFAISSYIPTMSAFELQPQEDSETAPRRIRLLAVPQPSTDGQVQLTGVQGEIEIIRDLATSSPFVDFREADGTVEDVLSKMTETNWVHFACHGTQDRINPFDSGLLLAHGRRLTLPDIAGLSRPYGGLAFLSACHTATGDEQLSEEAIHIAAGMLLAGYRGTIATMWSILDNDAPRVAQDVYENLFSNGKVPDTRQAAEALHDAVERLRDSGVSFLSWVPFIHVGL